MKLKLLSKSLFIICALTTAGLSQAQEIADLSYETSGKQLQQTNPLMENPSVVDSTHKKNKRIPPWFARRLKISAGAFFPINNTTIEVDGPNGNIGTELDFENDLGFQESNTTFLADIQWRASRRSRFDLAYFSLDRNTSRQLQREIKFGDNTYPINASVRAYFDVEIYRFSYGYAIFIDPKYEFGLMLGTHILRCGVGIEFIGATAQVEYGDDFDFTAPLPDLGLWGGYAFTDKWAFNGNVNYLSMKIDNIQGRILSYNLGVTYKFIPDLDMSLGYSGLNFDVTVEKRLEGYLKWGFNGPSISASYSFGSRTPFK